MHMRMHMSHMCMCMYARVECMLGIAHLCMSPSLTASLAILMPKIAHHFSNFLHLKSPATFWEADCRDLTSLCHRLCIGVKMRAASGP